MAVTIDSDSALVAFKAEILKSLTPEQREKIIGDAVNQLLSLKDNRYGSSHDFRNDAMSNALSTVMRETLIAVLKEPENKAKLDEAARKVVDAVTAKISEQLVAAVEKTIRGW